MNTMKNPMANESNTKADESKLVCDDPASGQSITFLEMDGREVITYLHQESGKEQAITLTDTEAAEIIAWKNSGRRNSFWNWPGWDAVRNRGKSGLT